MYDVAVVGAGFTGSVLARLFAEAGRTVVVVEERDHIAGNVYDYYDETGILVHKYGPHIFHTNDERIVAWLSRFTAWRPYEHRVLAWLDGRLVPFPINRRTLSILYGEEAVSNGVDVYLSQVAEPISHPQNARDNVLARVGEDLYQKFFHGYTKKQWGTEPEQLRASLTQRIPVRFDDDDRYFTDKYQVMPLHGYTSMFQRMLEHENIEIITGTPWEIASQQMTFQKVAYTGPIDRFFNYMYGPLPYRSLKFELEIVHTSQFQPAGTVNYPSYNVPWTRKTEFKHLTGQEHPWTVVCTEYPSATGDPYYPVPADDAEELASKYRRFASTLPHIWIGGRLGAYRYYNMDQVVASAMHAFGKLREQGW